MYAAFRYFPQVYDWHIIVEYFLAMKMPVLYTNKSNTFWLYPPFSLHTYILGSNYPFSFCIRYRKFISNLDIRESETFTDFHRVFPLIYLVYVLLLLWHGNVCRKCSYIYIIYCFVLFK